MYYESKNEIKKDKIVIFIFLIVIILLLCLLILKTDNNYSLKILSDYEAKKLSTNDEEFVDNKNFKIENIVKSVVGISKLKQSSTSVFLDNSEGKLGLGSGVILTEDGYILTNEHVAGGKYSNCYVTLENGSVYSGTVIWADSNIDLAILKISGGKFDYINLGDSDNVSLAEEVFAVGNPIGLEFQRTVTKGIISGINRTIKLEDEENYMEDLIQTDATINEGNSGGALINSKGELIGINTIKIDGAEGIGFAVPINIIKPIIEELNNNGKFEEAYLGIYGYDKEVIPYLDSEIDITNGIYIAKIIDNGSLVGKGIEEGDIIYEIDDINLNKMNDLKKYIYTKKPQDIVKLKIRRGRTEFEVDIKLENKK